MRPETLHPAYKAAKLLFQTLSVNALTFLFSQLSHFSIHCMLILSVCYFF